MFSRFDAANRHPRAKAHRRLAARSRVALCTRVSNRYRGEVLICLLVLELVLSYYS